MAKGFLKNRRRIVHYTTCLRAMPDERPGVSSDFELKKRESFFVVLKDNCIATVQPMRSGALWIRFVAFPHVHCCLLLADCLLVASCWLLVDCGLRIVAGGWWMVDCCLWSIRGGRRDRAHCSATWQQAREDGAATRDTAAINKSQFCCLWTPLEGMQGSAMVWHVSYVHAEDLAASDESPA